MVEIDRKEEDTINSGANQRKSFQKNVYQKGK